MCISFTRDGALHHYAFLRLPEAHLERFTHSMKEGAIQFD
jgi:hypothetical protein